jgi:ParB family chromosome partitioning protein
MTTHTIDTLDHITDFTSFSATVPLDRLMLSSINVRQTERDADVSSLAEDIAARGLKQNLVVIPAHFTTGEPLEQGANLWQGKFEVIAGGRRFQAMQLLVADGRMPADQPIPCLVEPRTEASETSLSENLHRVAMNPADEFAAFAVIVEQQKRLGTSEDDATVYTAKRFGVTASHVKGRLRLSSLAPKILEALRSNSIGLESAKAYGITSDHDAQLAVFNRRNKGTFPDHGARWVRDELRGRTVPADHWQVTYVGIEAYAAAGGRSETLMFMGTDGGEVLLDVALLEKLTREKAEAAIPARAKKDGYHSGIFAPGRQAYYNVKWPKEPKGYTRLYGVTAENPLKKADRKDKIAIYVINDAANGLDLYSLLKPEEPVALREIHVQETPEQRAARLREDEITRRAARLAVGTFAGSPFEGRTFWPQNQWRVDPIEFEWSDDDKADGAYVAVLVRVSQDDMNAQRVEAERLYDEHLAEQEAKAQAALDQNGVDAEGEAQDADHEEDA